MSYILDALKKSERDRTLVRGVGFADAARQVARRTDWLPWIIGGIVVATVALVATAFVMRDRLVPLRAAVPAAKPLADAPAVKPTPVAAPANEPIAAVPAAEVSADLPPLAEAKVAVAAMPAPAPQEPARFLAELPEEFQQSVPALAVNIHVYAEDETQRILYINNRQYYRGDEIAGGVLVEEIVPEGVVLEFRGQRFKLPRPS